MSLAFLILAHRLPSQVARLFTALYHRDDTFVLHFDWRAPRALHELGHELADSHPNVHILPPRRIVWGGPVMGEVQVEAMATALDSDRRWSHFLNLTGQDFPLKSRNEMLARFAAAPEKSYVSWFDPLDCDGLWSNARERLTRYHLTWAWLQGLLAIPGLGRRIKQLCGWKNQLPSLPGYQRQWPDFFRYYGGANHVALSQAAVRYLVEDPFARRIRRWLRAAGHPDEIMFQSVLLNSPLAPTLVNETLREIDFPRHSPHPRTFTSEDLPRLLESPALLARKFDASTDSIILDQLESRIRPALQS
jgi:hypothetical protein